MNAFCILFSDKNDNIKMNELADIRTLASVPFGGRYRLVDFMLSSLVGAGIREIGIVTRNKYGSLMDHVGWGKDWDLNRKNGGIVFLTPFLNNANDALGNNKFETLNSIKGFIDKTLQEYCIICESNIVFNVDFSKFMSFHERENADISLMYKQMKPSNGDLEIKVDDNGIVTDALYHTADTEVERDVCLNVILIKKRLLLSLIEQGITYGWTSIKKDIIAKKINEYKICGYNVSGYTAVIDDVNKYYNSCMDMLDEKIRDELFNGNNPIYTRIKDSVPTIYGEKCKITNSLIADGCNINGVVEDCIVFRDVKIEEGTVIKKSIIMQNTIIEKNSSLSCVITDKDVTITQNKMLAGSETMPFIINKGKIV